MSHKLVSRQLKRQCECVTVSGRTLLPPPGNSRGGLGWGRTESDTHFELRPPRPSAGVPGEGNEDWRQRRLRTSPAQSRLLLFALAALPFLACPTSSPSGARC